MGHAELLGSIDGVIAKTEEAVVALSSCIEQIDQGGADYPRVETSALLSVARHQLRIALGNLERAGGLERAR